jgi:predicted nucleotidyltransferase
MSTNSLDALLSPVRRDILAAIVPYPDRWWYLHALARHLDVTPSSLQRDLASLTEAGILRRRRDGNRVYYGADPACPILGALRELLLKGARPEVLVRESIEEIRRRIVEGFSPEKVILFGSQATGDAGDDSDVDVLVVMDVEGSTLHKAAEIRKSLRGIPISIDVLVVRPDELRAYATRTDTIFPHVLREGRELYDSA